MSIVIPIIRKSKKRVIVVVSDYRLPPTYRYPAAINDCHAAYLWMLEYTRSHHIDPERIVIAGSSSSGHLSLSTGFRLKRYGYAPRGIVAML